VSLQLSSGKKSFNLGQFGFIWLSRSGEPHTRDCA
jgi:hypothetical protein